MVQAVAPLVGVEGRQVAGAEVAHSGPVAEAGRARGSAICSVVARAPEAGDWEVAAGCT